MVPRHGSFALLMLGIVGAACAGRSVSERTESGCEECTSLGGASGLGGTSAVGGTSGAGASGAGPTGGVAGTRLLVCDGQHFGYLPRRLTSLDIHRTLDDLLGPGTTMQSSWPALRLGTRSFTAEDEARELVRMARARAAEYVAGRDFGCDLASAVCVRELILEPGSRLYRRPLYDGEVRGLTNLFAAEEASIAAETRFAAVVEAMIESPYFVFRVEMGDDDGDLNGFEVAARLAFFLWRQGPDDELWEAAWMDRLALPEDVEREALRMLADPRAHFGLAELTREWLGLADFDAFAQSLDLPDDVRLDMSEQTKRFLTELYGSAEPTLYRLLLETRQPMSAALAEHLDVPTYPESGFVDVDLDPERFSGILTHGTLLVPLPTLTRRGIYVRNVLLGERELASHEAVPELPGEPTRRATFEAILASPECHACHQAFDPIGFGLAGFDERGRAQDEDVNGSVLLDVVEGGIPFEGPRGLAEVLVQRPELSRRAARRWYAYALDREVAALALEAPIGPGAGAPSGPVPTEDCLASVLESDRKDLVQLAAAIARATPFRRLASRAPGFRAGGTEARLPLDYVMGETNALVGSYEGFEWGDARAELAAYFTALSAVQVDDAGAGGAAQAGE